MKNPHVCAIMLLVAALSGSLVGVSQTPGGGERSSLKYLTEHWQALPAETRAEQLGKLIDQYRARALGETDVETRNRFAVLLDIAEELEADPANGTLSERFFSLYLDLKRPRDLASVGREVGASEAPLTIGNGINAATVTIRPFDVPFSTGTIYYSWINGFVKSDFEIWAGDNILGTQFRGWVVFDLREIPLNATITRAILNVWTSVSSNSKLHELHVCAPVNNCEPRTATGDLLYSSLFSTPRFNVPTDCMQVSGPKTLYLNSLAISNLQQRIGRYNWWALGFVEVGDDADWGVFYGRDTPQRPTCDIVYETRVGVDEMGGSIPSAYDLQQNYPNPFNPSTMIRYGLPHKATVTLAVFNTLGQEVALLASGEEEAGYHEATFDAARLPTGVYYCRMRAGDFMATKRMLLVK